MSSDFCMETLLAGHSNTSATPLSSNSQTLKDNTNQAEQSKQIQSSSSLSTAVPSSPGVENREPKRKGLKRKRDDGVEHDDTNSTQKSKKRTRTAYTSAQLQQLETVFRQTQYPDMLTRQNIAEQMGLEEKKIHVWFQNRRAKQRKHGASGTAVPVTPAALRLPVPVPLPLVMCDPTHFPHTVRQASSQFLQPTGASSLSSTPISSSPASVISPPSVSNHPLYFPLRTPKMNTIPSSLPTVQSAASTSTYQPLTTERSRSASPQVPVYGSFHCSRLLTPVMVQQSESRVKSNSPEQLCVLSSSPQLAGVNLSSPHGGLVTNSQTTPPFSLKPSTVHLLRRSCSPDLTRSASISPQLPTLTLKQYLRTPSPQLNVAASPTVQSTPLSNHIENYSSVIPASYSGCQTVVNHSGCNSSNFRVL